MFGTATIRLGIGPHSSLVMFFLQCLFIVSLFVQFCPRLRHVDGVELLIPTGIAQDLRLTAAHLPPAKVDQILLCVLVWMLI